MIIKVPFRYFFCHKIFPPIRQSAYIVLSLLKSTYKMIL